MSFRPHWMCVLTHNWDVREYFHSFFMKSPIDKTFTPQGRFNSLWTCSSSNLHYVWALTYTRILFHILENWLYQIVNNEVKCILKSTSMKHICEEKNSVKRMWCITEAGCLWMLAGVMKNTCGLHWSLLKSPRQVRNLSLQFLKFFQYTCNRHLHPLSFIVSYSFSRLLVDQLAK